MFIWRPPLKVTPNTGMQCQLLNLEWRARSARADWECSGFIMCDHTSCFNWQRSQIVCRGAIAFICVNETSRGSTDEREVKTGEILIWNNVAMPLLSPRRHKHGSVKCWSQPTAWLTWAVKCLSSLARVLSSYAPAATSRWRKTLLHACRKRHKRGRLKGNQHDQPLENQH